MKNYFFAIVCLFLTVVAFSGVVSAEATVDVSYTDSNDVEISEAQVGDLVNTNIEVQNDENTVRDAVVEAHWTDGIEWEQQGTPRVSLDGGQTWTDDPTTVTYGDHQLTWTIGQLAANQLAIFQWPDYPSAAGSEIFTATLYNGEVVMDSDDATLTVTEPTNTSNATDDASTTAAAGTVGMQETGSPVGLLLLAFGLLSTGLVYSRKQ